MERFDGAAGQGLDSHQPLERSDRPRSAGASSLRRLPERRTLRLSLAREADVARKLACWIGRHTWVTRVEQGESDKVCSACGKPPRSGRGDIDIDSTAGAFRADGGGGGAP